IELVEQAQRDCSELGKEIALLVPHQVNLRIIDAAREALALPADRVVVNIDRYGNTSAASVPLALDEAVRTGRARPGDTVLLVAFLVVSIDLLGFGIVLPLVPRYADTFLAGYPETEKGVVIGLLYSSFSLMQFVFSPVWGRVSDRVGRRPILLMSLLGSVV